MKFTQFALAAALLATASAQGLDALPDCAKSCATSSIPASCGLNVQCICSDKSFLSNIACCVAGKCSQADQETTIQVAKGICAGGGVTDLPATVACSSTAAGSSSTASSGNATESSTETKTGTAASGSKTTTATDTTLTGSASPTQTSASTTGSSASGASSAASSASKSASSAAATTGAAVLGQTRDSSLLAAAAGAAAFAIFV